MEDKEKEISEKENGIDSTNVIEKIDKLKEFIMGEYKEALLRTIEVDNLEKLRETIKNLDTKYEKDVKGLREKFDLIIELGEKISTIDTKCSNSIENLKNNEIKNLDTKYLDVLGKFDELKDKIIEDKDKRIGKLEEKLVEKERELESKKTELEENKASILNLTQKLEQEKANNEREVSILNEQLREKEAELVRKINELEEKISLIQGLTQKLEEEKANNQREVNTLNEQLREKEAELERKTSELEEKISLIQGLTQKLEEEKANNQREVNTLNEQLREKEAGLERKTSELEEKTAFIQKLTQKLEEEKANNQREVNTLNEQLREKKAELEMKNNQLTFLEEKTENEKTENEKAITGLKIALNNFYEKIEKPYENLLKAIEESKVAESIGNYLGFNNEKGLSKSMILFALASDDNLARKVAMFYLERKEILEKEDFRIIEEVNNIYTNKPWGILYAEPEGVYQSSLVKDRKSSSIYRNFTAMYSPAYRPDETGNSPIKGIVDGK